MRNKLVPVVVIASACVMALVVYGWKARLVDASSSGVNSKHASSGQRLIVHEWGTFTSFSGSNSVKLEFRPLVENDLPPFVLTRTEQQGVPNPFGKYSIRALQRMETPVTYFYSDVPRELQVRVSFPQGLLTEFFPPVKTMLPEFRWYKPEPLVNSSLDWGHVWIVPEHTLVPRTDNQQLAAQLHTQLLKKLLPQTAGYDHYAFARETDSAMVFVDRPAEKGRPLAPRGGFFEKFLFYRGVGNFDLPLKLLASSDGRFQLSNSGPEAIRSLFLVTVEGKHLQFTQYDQIRSGEQLTLTQSASQRSIDELVDEVTRALVAEGLYQKEAQAMVNTWRTSWFGEQGTRLFYLLPQRSTDELLPLSIRPQPDELIRVMVGRLEITTPEAEHRVLQAVESSLLARADWAKQFEDATESEPYPFPEEILNLGRLAEPALVRTRQLAEKPAVRNEAGLLLVELRKTQSEE